MGSANTEQVAIGAVALTLALALAAFPLGATPAGPTHAIAMHGSPREAPGFAHFGYVNPAAPKGGRVTLGYPGNFDSLNPLIVKGVPAHGIRDYVIESLLARSADEPFALYGLLAERIEVPDDRSAITFHLDPRARFSDGKPVTVDDVLFSFEVLRERGRPNYRTYYKKVSSAERLSERTVRFGFSPEVEPTAAGGATFDREMPLIMGLMPVLPKHAMTPESFEQTTLEAFVASGPYTIARVEAGRSVVYQLNPDYWGRDLPVNRGRFNFAEIRVEYFREAATLFEAFKRGEIDLRLEEDPARWAEGYRFPAVESGRVLKREFDLATPAGMTAMAFNVRRPMFADARVRQAMILLFDFEFANRSLYHGLFKRTESYFERSELSSVGRAADAEEQRLLAPFGNAIKPDVLEGRFRQPTSDGSGQNRDNWRQAFALLRAAGYEQKGTRLIHAASGQHLAFEILATSSAQERLLLNFTSGLERLGIAARVRLVDSAQYQVRLSSYDFDMIQTTWPSSLSPGNEQLFRWSSKAATTPGTYNFVGVESPAVDAMISAMLQARTPEAFVPAVRALDRVLISGDFVIPLFHVPKQWVAHWRHLKGPERTPISGFALDAWWSEVDK